jgi:hypothetical protein
MCPLKRNTSGEVKLVSLLPGSLQSVSPGNIERQPHHHATSPSHCPHMVPLVSLSLLALLQFFNAYGSKLSIRFSCEVVHFDSSRTDFVASAGNVSEMH